MRNFNTRENAKIYYEKLTKFQFTDFKQLPQLYNV